MSTAKVDNITNAAGDGAVDFPQGITLNSGAAIIENSGNQASNINIGSYTDVTSMSLTKGRWIVTAYQQFEGASGPNPGTKKLAISEHSGATTTDHTLGVSEWQRTHSSGTTVTPVVSGTRIIQVASTTTYYMKIQDGVGTVHQGDWAMVATQIQ